MKRVIEPKRSSDHIAGDIARTQMRIDATLEALADRLKPKNLARDAAKSVAASARRASARLARNVTGAAWRLRSRADASASRDASSLESSSHEPVADDHAIVVTRHKSATRDAQRRPGSKRTRKALAIGAAGLAVAGATLGGLAIAKAKRSKRKASSKRSSSRRSKVGKRQRPNAKSNTKTGSRSKKKRRGSPAKAGSSTAKTA